LLANIFNTGQIIAKAIDVCQVVGGWDSILAWIGVVAVGW
jgi:hypothetical protein